MTAPTELLEGQPLPAISAEVCRNAFAPPPELTLSEWSDAYRWLSKESAAEPGPFRTARLPYLRAIMDALSDERTREVVFAKSAQIGASTVSENLIGYTMHQDPSGILVVYPTDKALRHFSTKRLDPMLRDSPVLAAMFPKSGRRDASDSMTSKLFPGGYLAALTAGSTADLRSHSARRAVAEELDEWDADVGEQGDPLDLLRVRIRAFWNGKLYIPSTPTLKGFSRVWAELETSTWQEYFVTCPHCRHLQTLRWQDLEELGHPVPGAYRLLFERDDAGELIPGTCRYACEDCGAAIEERWKEWMLDPANGAGWRARFPGRAKVGFHINTLYSPLCPWDDIATAFLRAKRSPSQLKTFVNTFLGLPFSEEGDQVNPNALAARVEAYPSRDGVLLVPRAAGLLTASVDVQGDRLELSVWAWGPGRERWLMSWEQLDGDPGQDAVWGLLDTRLFAPWRHEAGALMMLAAVAIDAGYNTERVHRYCESRTNRRTTTGLPGPRIVAVVGREGRGRPLIQAPGAERIKRSQKTKKRPTHTVGTDSGKDLVAAALRVPPPAPGEQPGPGYVHFPDTLDPVFFDQLTAERLVTRYRKGRPQRVWELLPLRRNEALDLTVYAEAALQLLGARVIRDIPLLVEQLVRAGEALAAGGQAAPPATRGRRIISRGIE